MKPRCARALEHLGHLPFIRASVQHSDCPSVLVLLTSSKIHRSWSHAAGVYIPVDSQVAERDYSHPTSCWGEESQGQLFEGNDTVLSMRKLRHGEGMGVAQDCTISKW